MTRCDQGATTEGEIRSSDGAMLCPECYGGEAEILEPSANGSEQGRQVELELASGIRSEHVRWLWQDRAALRGVIVVPGEKGLGKSILTNAWLPAQITRGTLDGEMKGKPADVLIGSAEDDWASVIKPRLIAHGADLDRVHRVRVRDEAGDSLLTLPDDCPQLEQKIKQLRAEGRTIGMLVIDPIGAFLSDATDSHRDASVRRALAPLAALAERLDLAVFVVAHLTKDESKRLIQRVSGAGAFVNAARSVLAFARDPGDPEGEQGNERVLVHVSSNWGRYAPSLAAQIESRDVEVDDGSTADVGYLAMKGETTIGVEELQQAPDENGSDAEEAIGAVLVNGSQPSRAVKKKVADELDCSPKTVERAAMKMRDRGNLEVETGGFPKTTTWALASGDRQGTAVGTSPNTKRVPTDRRDIPSGIPASSGDIRDSLQAGVPTAGEPSPTEVQMRAMGLDPIEERDL